MMPKFKFECEHEADENFPGRINCVEFYAETWDEVLPEMTTFLKACGYTFKGEVEIVEPISHSCHYYNVDRNR